MRENVQSCTYCSGIANSAIVWFLCDANCYGSFLNCLVCTSYTSVMHAALLGLTRTALSFV